MIGEGISESDSAVETLEAVASLESNNATAVKFARKHHRFEIRTQVLVQPSDSIDRDGADWRGECHDISNGGCRLLLNKPLQLGSIYWIQFKPSTVTLDPVFARCVRGCLLRENAFEFGMSFLTPIELPSQSDDSAVELDLV